MLYAAILFTSTRDACGGLDCFRVKKGRESGDGDVPSFFTILIWWAGMTIFCPDEMTDYGTGEVLPPCYPLIPLAKLRPTFSPHALMFLFDRWLVGGDG